MILEGETEVRGENPVPPLPCAPQIPHKMP